MTREIKTEDIIKALRCHADATSQCVGCVLEAVHNTCPTLTCIELLCCTTADRLEQLQKRLDELVMENELLRGALKSAAHMKVGKLTIDIKQLLTVANVVPLAEYNERKLYAGTWHHFKGKDYFVCGIAVHTETNDILVLYKDSIVSPKQYARPLSMFMSEVDRKKYPDASQKYRFERRILNEQ